MAGHRKLTTEQAVWARQNCNPGCAKYGFSGIGRILGLGKSQVSDLIHGDSYKDVAIDVPTVLRPREVQDATVPRDKALCARGKGIPSAVLNDDVVTEIRLRYISGDRRNGASAIARELGVAVSTIRKAAVGLTWTHVPMPYELS